LVNNVATYNHTGVQFGDLFRPKFLVSTCLTQLSFILFRFLALIFKQVRTEEELIEVIETINGEQKDSLCFVEVMLHKDDTSKELLEWGSRVAAANSRPPNPQ
jgi:hypothetical protein